MSLRQETTRRQLFRMALRARPLCSALVLLFHTGSALAEKPRLAWHPDFVSPLGLGKAGNRIPATMVPVDLAYPAPVQNLLARTITHRDGKPFQAWEIGHATGEQNRLEYADLPTYDVPKNDWGQSLNGPGEAAYKDAYVYKPDPTLALVLLKPNFLPELIDEELQRLDILAEYELPVLTVNGIVRSNGRRGFLCERFAENSKDIFYNYTFQNAAQFSTFLTQDSSGELEYVRDTLISMRIRIRDQQIGVRENGSVLIHDPGPISIGRRPEQRELEKIDELIQIAQKYGF